MHILRSRLIIISFIVLTVITSITLYWSGYPSACPWQTKNPWPQKVDTSKKFTLTAHADPEHIKSVQVYSSKSSDTFVVLDFNLLGCRRHKFSPLVAEKALRFSGTVKFLLPPGDYFVIGLPSFWAAVREKEGIPISKVQNVHLESDSEITLLNPTVLLPL